MSIPDQNEIPLVKRIPWMKRPDLPVILLTGGLLVAAVTTVLTFATEDRWIGHAVTGMIGLVLMIVVILTGAQQAGRIHSSSLLHTFRYHRMAGTWFSIFVIGTFLLGLLTTMGHDEPLLASPHGITGLVLVLMAVLQLAAGLLIRKGAGMRVVHRYTGYAMVPVFVLQMMLGILAVEIL
jgi:hypothetical protein